MNNFHNIKFLLLFCLFVVGSIFFTTKVNAKWGSENHSDNTPGLSTTGPCSYAPTMDTCDLPASPCSFKAEFIQYSVTQAAVKIERIENTGRCSTSCSSPMLAANYTTFKVNVRYYASSGSSYTRELDYNTRIDNVRDIPIQISAYGYNRVEILSAWFEKDVEVNGVRTRVNCRSNNLGTFNVGVVNPYPPYVDAWIHPEDDLDETRYDDLTINRGQRAELHVMSDQGGAFEVHCGYGTVKDFNSLSDVGSNTRQILLVPNTNGVYTYYVGCKNVNRNDTVWDQVVLRVVDPPPTIDLWTNSDGLKNIKGGSVSVAANTDVNLYWSSTQMGSSQCQVTSSPNNANWSGNKSNSGSINLGRLTPNSTNKFTITCTNSTGTDSDDVTVNVGAVTINGQCGTASGRTYGVGETCWGTFTLCSAGTPDGSPVCPAAGSRTTWTCLGSGPGASNALGCSAWRASAVGVCGGADNHTFAYNETSYTSTYNQCSNGTASSTLFPSQGSSAAWYCNGAGGNSKQCVAYRQSPPNQLPVGSVTSSTCGIYTGTVYDPDGNTPLSLVFSSGGVVINGNLVWSGNNFTFTFTPIKNGVTQAVSVVATDTKGGATVLSGDSSYVCPLCGTASRLDYRFNESLPNTGYCIGGSPIPSLSSSTALPVDWKCYESGAGSYSSDQCRAARKDNAMTITDTCPTCGDAQINFTVSINPEVCN